MENDWRWETRGNAQQWLLRVGNDIPCMIAVEPEHHPVLVEIICRSTHVTPRLGDDEHVSASLTFTPEQVHATRLLLTAIESRLRELGLLEEGGS